MLKKILKSVRQKGQAMILVALLSPLLLLFVMAVIEFGWWFVSQSRLQNAADAAVVAGAQEIAAQYKKTHDTSTYTSSLSVDFVNRLPGEDTGLTRSDSGTTGDAVALKYVDRNFPSKETVLSKISDENDLAGKFYYETLERYHYGNTESLSPLYYVVELTGKVEHLFSWMEQFGEMPIHVLAVAKINESKVAVLESLKFKNVIAGNWEVQNMYRLINETETDSKGNTVYKNQGKRTEFQNATGHETLFTGKWNHYQYQNKDILYKGINSESGQCRQEIVDVYVTTDRNGANGDSYTASASGSATATKANGTSATPNGTAYTWQEVESLNLDFAQDFGMNLTNGAKYSVTDWDVGYKLPNDVTSIYAYGPARDNSLYGWDLSKINFRIHALLNFYEPFPCLADNYKNNGNYYYYPIWARIESEPMWSYLGPSGTITTLDTVHQMIININGSNWMNEDKNGNPIPVTAPTRYGATGPVIYRPLVIIYDGPETNATNMFLDKAKINSYNGETRPTERTPQRTSKPVILNLNADFAGVLYVPNSDVAIITNGHKFKGFIMAKGYKKVKTDAELSGETDIMYVTHRTLNWNRTERYALKLPVKIMDYSKTMDPETGIMHETGDRDYEKIVHGEVQFRDATPAELEAELPELNATNGSKYSIFNIEELKDTFFDPNHPYTPKDNSSRIFLRMSD